MLSEGIDLKYGARHLKRSVERFLVYPLSNLVATEQVETGDFVMVDFDVEKELLSFTKQSGKMIVADAPVQEVELEPLKSADAIGLPLPTAIAAAERGKSKGENHDA